MFAGGRGAVMATGASAGNAGVVKADIQPVIRYMAVITGIGTGDMGRRFAGCSGAIVAAGAGAGNGAVINP